MIYNLYQISDCLSAHEIKEPDMLYNLPYTSAIVFVFVCSL